MQKDTKQTNILPSNQRPNLSNQNSNLPSYNYDSHAYGTQTVPTKRLIENKVYTYGLVSRKEYIRRKQNTDIQKVSCLVVQKNLQNLYLRKQVKI